MKLVPGTHGVNGSEMVELRSDSGDLVACLYATAAGLKIVSKYIVNIPELVMIEVQLPPALLVNLAAGMNRHCGVAGGET